MFGIVTYHPSTKHEPMPPRPRHQPPLPLGRKPFRRQSQGIADGSPQHNSGKAVAHGDFCVLLLKQFE
jgi:hypothetical protein